jgi:hypothetical protein
LGTFNIAEIVWYPSPYQHNPVSELYRPFLWPHDLVFALTIFLSTVGPYIDRCVPFQIMPSQLNLHTGGLQSSSINISRSIDGNRMHLSSKRVWIFM